MKKPFCIDDQLRLTVLHRALMEAKFSLEPVDNVLPGSPILADVMNQVVDTFIEWEKEEAKEEGSATWETWRMVTPSEKRREVDIAREYIKRADLWATWTYDEKAEYVEILLSPLKGSRDLVDLLINSR